MKHQISLLALLLSAGLLAGCAAGRHAEEQPYPRTEISYSSGGGFSGLYTGYTIAANRVVTSWNGRGGVPSKVDTIGTVNEEQFHNLLEQIYDADPVHIQHQQTGNMTTVLTIVSDDEQYLYTWEGVHTDTAAVPVSVLPLQTPVWKLLREMDTADR